MASYSSEFVGPMIKAMHSISPQLGTDIMWANKELYNVVLELLCLHAMTLKILQDLHPSVVTDVALQTRLNNAIATDPNGPGWLGWIMLQIPPESLAQYGATEADSIATLQAKIAAYQAANS